MQFGTFFRENLRLSFASIVGNRLRSILTITIIAIGILSLVGIVTAIESIKESLVESFASMGTNNFSIRDRQMFGMGRNARTRNDNFIPYKQACEFRDRFELPATVSLSMYLGGGATARYGSNETNPNLTVAAFDENGLSNSGLELAEGRSFSKQEVERGDGVIIIGGKIAELLFPNGERPVGKMITVLGSRYEVIGVLASRGSNFGMDNNEGLRTIVPITTAQRTFSWIRASTEITVSPTDPRLLDLAMSEAEGLFRSIRRLGAGDAADFAVERSDALVELLANDLATVTLVASIVGIITLLGAAVGLMNIMLVAVNERTREIGTRMALGAKPRMIRQQFLFESILISQLGGICGIVLGIVCGNLVALLTGGAFVVPWGWLLIGMGLCLAVGIGSGYLPARRAAGLSPVEALRYE